MVSTTPRPLYPGKDPVPIVEEAGWAPGPVWTGAENLAPPTGIRSPDRPARSESLYRLSYPGPNLSIPYIFRVYGSARRRRKVLWEEPLVAILGRCLLRMTSEVWVPHVTQACKYTACLRVVFLSCFELELPGPCDKLQELNRTPQTPQTSPTHPGPYVVFKKTVGRFSKWW